MKGGVPERPKGSDCKSDGRAFGGSNPPPTTIHSKSYVGDSKIRAVDYMDSCITLLHCVGSFSFINNDVNLNIMSGSSSVGRASAFQAERREFEPRLPLHFNDVFAEFTLLDSLIQRPM